MTEYTALSMIEHGDDRKPELPKAPDNVAGKLAWLKTMTEEDERLKKIKEEFIATGNVALLQEFTPTYGKIYPVKSLENIPDPCALFGPLEKLSDKEIKALQADVEQMFPGITSQTVTWTTGEHSIAFIGQESLTVTHALELVWKERDVSEAIKEQSTKLGKYTPVENKDRATAQQGVEILPTPSKPASAMPGAKKGFQIV